MIAAELRAALACGRSGCACRRGKATHCPGHEDKNPSLGVDERAGRVLVVCRAGCSQTSVLDALRARGLWPSSPALTARRRAFSLLEEARRRVLAEARRQPWARPGVLDCYAAADRVRLARTHVDRLRRLGTRLGDREEAWALLLRAARTESFVALLEVELDELRDLGRIA